MLRAHPRRFVVVGSRGTGGRGIVETDRDYQSSEAGPGRALAKTTDPQARAAVGAARSRATEPSVTARCAAVLAAALEPEAHLHLDPALGRP
jgi:hypothetical protein